MQKAGALAMAIGAEVPLVFQPSLIGYNKVFTASHIGTYFMNSLIVTLVSMVLVLLFGAMAAWALTEYRFRGSTALALFLSIGIMVPIRLGSVAILKMMGVEETVGGSLDDYIAIAVRLARDTVWRQTMRSKMLERKHRLYRDAACIAALEDFLEHAARNPG